MIHHDPVDLPITERRVGAAWDVCGCRQYRVQLSCRPEDDHVQCLAND